MTDTRKNQCLRILELLRKHEWVSLPQILSLYIASHTRRIHELRKQGYRINMVKEGRNVKYSLVGEPEKVV